jgi:hypothetical protein
MKWLGMLTLFLVFTGATAAILCGCYTSPFGYDPWLTYTVESGDWPMVARISYMVDSVVFETTTVLPWGYSYPHNPGDSVLLSATNPTGQSWLIVKIGSGSALFRSDSCFNLGDTAIVTCRM